MKIASESFAPDRALLERVRAFAGEIKADQANLAPWLDNYVASHSERISRDLAIVCRYAPRDGRLIEFGSIPLLLTLALADQGWSVDGVDIDPGRFQRLIADRKLRIAKCDIETSALPFKSDYYDVAIFNELFEHLRINPVFTLNEVRRVLKPDGLLLLSTPNLRSLVGLYNFIIKNKAFSCAGEIYEEYAKLESLGHMGHVREYTTREVREFLERIGFSVETLIYRGKYRNPAARTLCRLLPGMRPFATFVAKKR